MTESYYEDYSNSNRFFDTEEAKIDFYQNMNAGAESGWDYSSKW